MVKVSVLIPVYGVEKYIKKFINSLKEQDFSDVEFIIVNDASIDNSHEIILEEIKLDSRFKYIKKDINEGEMKARQTAYEISKGDYIINIDSDDFISECFISSLYYMATEHQLDFVTCNVIPVTEEEERINHGFMGFDSNFIYRDIRDSLILPYATWARLTRRELLEKYEYKYTDGEMSLTRLQFLSDIKVGHSSDAVLFYRQRLTSLSSIKNSSKRLENRFDENELFNIYKNDLKLTSQLSNEFKIFRLLNLTKLVFVAGINSFGIWEYTKRVSLLKKIYNLPFSYSLKSAFKVRRKDRFFCLLVVLGVSPLSFLLYKKLRGVK